MRKLIILALLCLPLAAQTAINDTLYLQGATPWTGQITVSWPAFTSCAGVPIARGSRTVAVNAGVVAISLWPSDCAAPSFAYSATYRTMGGANHGQSWTETWAVPSSPSIVTLRGVRQSSTLKFFPSQLIAAGLADGSYCIDVASEAATGLVACSGGGGGGASPAGSTGDIQYKASGSTFGAATIANCTATGGVLQYNSSTHAFSCHSLVAGDIPALSYEPAISTGGTSQYWRGDKSWQTLTSSVVPEGTNLYFTNSRAQTAMAGLYESPLTFSAPLSRSTNTVSLTACSDGEIRKYRIATGWTCEADQTGSGTTPYSCAVSAVSSIACTHNLGTSQPWVACYDASGNMLGSTGASTSVTSVVATSTNVATLTFSGSTTATCVISTGSMGPAGTQGTAGTAGSNGTNGNTILNGTGAPSNGTGANGDYYIRTDTTCIYGPKAAGVWPGSCTSMIGPAGSGSGDMLKATYDPASRNGQVLTDPGANGILKRTASGATAAASAGVDYYAPGGAIASTDLPNPGASTGGKVQSKTCSAGQHVSAIGTDSTVTCSADSGGGTAKTAVRLNLYSSAMAPSTSTHYFQAYQTAGTASATNTSKNHTVTIPVTGTIVAVAYTIYNNGNSTAPSTDTSVSLCINATSGGTCNGTSVSVWTGAMPLQFAWTQGVATVSQAVTAGDKINIDMLPGTFTTNAQPTVVVDVIIQ